MAEPVSFRREAPYCTRRVSAWSATADTMAAQFAKEGSAPTGYLCLKPSPCPDHPKDPGR